MDKYSEQDEQIRSLLNRKQRVRELRMKTEGNLRQTGLFEMTSRTSPLKY